MKKLNNRLTKLLRNSRGESLIETIIAILIFTALLTGVTMMISSSTSSLRETRREAEAMQRISNEINTRTAPTKTTNITVTLEASSAPNPVVTRISVNSQGEIVSENDIIYFYPTTTP